MSNVQIKRLDLKCLKCGSGFRRLPCRMTKSNRAFCSKTCFFEYRRSHPREWLNGTCQICGKEYTRDKKVQKFCSTACAGKARNRRVKKLCVTCGEEFESNINRKKFCSRECKHQYDRKHKRPKTPVHCDECGKLTYKYISQVKAYLDGKQKHMFCSHACRMRHYASGENNSHWKGGITHYRKRIRELTESKVWTLAVLTRDDFTCQLCSQRGGDLHVHHAIPFAILLESLRALVEQDKDLVQSAHAFKPMWNVSNGITVCKSCHNLIHGT